MEVNTWAYGKRRHNAPTPNSLVTRQEDADSRKTGYLWYGQGLSPNLHLNTFRNVYNINFSTGLACSKNYFKKKKIGIFWVFERA